ncbi:MAG: hypothetical protein K0U29_08890 [Gammaproteobacteria bacterium]|nr:hypothetical protein [Gammaproteobacteria bacterium]MCH9745029.1 hypothetical protein [Gammaproteobacteria bacterium]
MTASRLTEKQKFILGATMVLCVFACACSANDKVVIAIDPKRCRELVRNYIEGTPSALPLPSDSTGINGDWYRYCKRIPVSLYLSKREECHEDWGQGWLWQQLKNLWDLFNCQNSHYSDNQVDASHISTSLFASVCNIVPEWKDIAEHVAQFNVKCAPYR